MRRKEGKRKEGYKSKCEIPGRWRSEERARTKMLLIRARATDYFVGIFQAWGSGNKPNVLFLLLRVLIPVIFVRLRSIVIMIIHEINSSAQGKPNIKPFKTQLPELEDIALRF